MARDMKMIKPQLPISHQQDIITPINLSGRKPAFSDFTDHETARFKNGDFYDSETILTIDILAFTYYGHRHDKRLPLDMLYMRRTNTIPERGECF